MKTIKILGTGCAKCKATMALIEQVAVDLGVEVSLIKVEDLPQIMAYNVMSTPAVVVDEKVVHKGGLPSRFDVEKWLVG